MGLGEGNGNSGSRECRAGKGSVERARIPGSRNPDCQRKRIIFYTVFSLRPYGHCHTVIYGISFEILFSGCIPRGRILGRRGAMDACQELGEAIYFKGAPRAAGAAGLGNVNLQKSEIP